MHSFKTHVFSFLYRIAHAQYVLKGMDILGMQERSTVYSIMNY